MPAQHAAHRNRRTTRVAWITLLSVILVVGAVVGTLIARRNSGHNVPVAANKPLSIPELRTQYLQDINAYRSSQAQVNQVLAPITADITKQEQRVKDDANTYAANRLGNGCTPNSTNPSAYSACVSQEKQAATTAQDDAATANTQLAQDRSRALTLGRISVGYVDSVLQQLNSISWPSNLRSESGKLVASLVQYRKYFAKELAAFSKNDISVVNSDAAHATTAYSSMQKAIQALNAALGVPAAGS